MVLWSLFYHLVDVSREREREREKDVDVGCIRCHETNFIQWFLFRWLPAIRLAVLVWQV